MSGTRTNYYDAGGRYLGSSGSGAWDAKVEARTDRDLYQLAIQKASDCAKSAIHEARKWSGTPCHWERDAGSYAALAAHYGFKLLRANNR